jgi:hypothetical protein
MKTTLDITESLLDEARKVAHREGTTLRALVEQGLRRILSEKKKPGPAFKLRKASLKGRGLHPEMQGATWDQILEKIYEGRGG